MVNTWHAMELLNKNIIDDAATLEEVRKKVWQLLETVPDPEVPVLSVIDLGVVRSVDIIPIAGTYEVKVFRYPHVHRLSRYPCNENKYPHGIVTGRIYQDINIIEILSPAWTTDWISEQRQRKIKSIRNRSTAI
jgi:ring-1,2-phenylacetyl-CoA epoxidase subunit PaaD